MHQNIFKETHGPLDKNCLSALEQIWGFKLPEDYRNFLLQYNGGESDKKAFNFYETREGSILHPFFGIYRDSNYNLLLNISLFLNRIPSNCIPIASDTFGNQILISVKNPDRGKIYWWDHEREADPNQGEKPDYSNLVLVANSFTEFIENLKDDAEID